MAEYTYEDIIMDPNDPRLEGAIGKECYLSDFPKIVLDVARSNSTVDRLKRIEKEKVCPFVNEEEESNWTVIIIKKEEPKPKYMPFETLDEFIESYKKTAERIDCSNIEGYIASCGMWLKDTDRDVYCLVTEIWNYGVVVGDSKMKTTNEGDDEYFTINEVTTWKTLLREYTFMDDSPCGKLMEE